MLIYGFSLPWVLTSWLYVLLVGAQVAYKLAKDRGAPQAVREFRWRLRNVDLSFDDLVRELMKLAGENPENFESFRDQIRSEVRERGL